MKNTKIEVPGVAWWVLGGLLIPPFVVWLEQTYPGAQYPWAVLLGAALGAVLKWLQWVLQENGQTMPTQFEDETNASRQYTVDFTPEKEKFSWSWFLFGAHKDRWG